MSAQTSQRNGTDRISRATGVNADAVPLESLDEAPGDHGDTADDVEDEIRRGPWTDACRTTPPPTSHAGARRGAVFKPSRNGGGSVRNRWEAEHGLRGDTPPRTDWDKSSLRAEGKRESAVGRFLGQPAGSLRIFLAAYGVLSSRR